TRNPQCWEPCWAAAAWGTGSGRDFLLSQIPVSTRLPAPTAGCGDSHSRGGDLAAEVPLLPPPRSWRGLGQQERETTHLCFPAL
ncbi:hypothetical protein MC885_004799, partial [Smutsia gigantea]